MSIATWPGIVTALVAVYAAGLSTYNFIVERRDKRPRARVVVRYGFALPDVTYIMTVDVSNAGSRPFTVTSVGLELPDKRHVVTPQVPMHASLPVELTTGQGYTHWMQPQQVAQSLQENGLSGKIKFRAFCHDANDRAYYSKWGTFDIEQEVRRD